jgi:hypothetical protein
MTKSQIEQIRALLTKEFLREMIEELIDAATDYGRSSDDKDGQSLNLAAEKLYNAVEALEIKP